MTTVAVGPGLADAQEGVAEASALTADGLGTEDAYSVALTRAFGAFDADGDGKLTEEEVMAALTRKTGQGTELSEEAARATWKRWQMMFDLNDDGKISYEELATSSL